MNCRKVSNLLVLYKDDELPEEQYYQVREHLEKCQRCLGALKEYEELDKILVSLRSLFEVKKSTQEEIDRTWAGVQLKLAARQKSRPSFKARVLDWVTAQYPFYQPRLRLVTELGFVIVLISGFLYFKTVLSTQSISIPSMVTSGTVKVWKEKGGLTFEPKMGEELLIDVDKYQKVKVKTPNVQIEAGGNTQFYLKPEEEGPTTVGVVFTYDAVSLLTKRSRIDLTSGTTAYVYPDGKISKPEKISKIQLKKWQDVIEGQSIQKPGKN